MDDIELESTAGEDECTLPKGTVITMNSFCVSHSEQDDSRLVT